MPWVTPTFELRGCLAEDRMFCADLFRALRNRSRSISVFAWKALTGCSMGQAKRLVGQPGVKPLHVRYAELCCVMVI